MADVTTPSGGGGKTPGTPNTYIPVAAVPIPIGSPVAPSLTEAREVVLAGAGGGADFANPTGIAVTTGVAGHHFLVQYAGPLSLSTAQWDAVTGQTGGLTPGIYYYLSVDEFGKLTDTPPTDPATVQAPVGLALSHTDMMIRLSRRKVNI